MNTPKMRLYEFTIYVILWIFSCLNKGFAQCTTPILPPQQVVASIEGSKPVVKVLDFQNGNKYQIFRANAKNDFIEIGKTNISQFSDNDINIDPSAASYCYYIKKEDACGNISAPSTTVCTMNLRGTGAKLFWNEPFLVKNSNITITYEVYSLDNTLSLVSGKLTTNGFVAKPTQNPTETYIIKATVTWLNSNLQTELFSNNYDANTLLVYIPNAFSPNNDGVNDVWGVKSVAIRSSQIYIYNRWGNLVYFSDDHTKTWNGTQYNGNNAASDVYNYVFEYTDLLNQKWKQTGVVNLLR